MGKRAKPSAVKSSRTKPTKVKPSGTKPSKSAAASAKPRKKPSIRKDISQKTTLGPSLQKKISLAEKEQKGLPSKEECYQLWDTYHMPENIRQHTKQVTRVAVFIARKLKQKGIKINLALVERGAMLHDIDKILTLKSEKHGEVAEKILLRRGYPELARIAITHRFKYIRDPTLTWEEKVVNYADKRVKHNQIVSIDERFTDLLIRYGVKVPDHEAIQLFFLLEKELFGIMGLDPLRLEECMAKERL